jgi:multiple sugar transport system permease protein
MFFRVWDKEFMGKLKMDLERGAALILTLPVLLFLLAIFIYPLFYGIYLSFHSTSKGLANLQYVGLKNYWDILTSQLFWLGMKNTVVYTVGTVGLTVGFGLGIALLLNSIEKGVWIYRAILILPLGMSAVVSGMTWQMMMNPLSGIINYLLQSVGLPTSLWHTGINSAMISVIIIESWQWTPFPLFVIYAGLQMLPQEPFEAARIDGASAWQQMRFITLPLAWPVIGIALTFRLIGAFRSFDILYAVTKGGPGRATDTLIIQAYQESFSYFRFEYGLVVGIAMMLITIAMCAALLRRVTRKA